MEFSREKHGSKHFDIVYEIKLERKIFILRESYFRGTNFVELNFRKLPFCVNKIVFFGLLLYLMTFIHNMKTK